MPLPEVPLLGRPPPLDVPLPDVPLLGRPPPVEVPLPEVPLPEVLLPEVLLPDPPLLGLVGVDEGGGVDGGGVGVAATGGADGALGAGEAGEPEPTLGLVLPVPTLGAWVATTVRAVLVVACERTCVGRRTLIGALRDFGLDATALPCALDLAAGA